MTYNVHISAISLISHDITVAENDNTVNDKHEHHVHSEEHK